jgi:hypothetical protein
MDDFEATYRGFIAGIDVLGSRTWKGRQQWRVHWHGRPAAEDRWVDGKLMDPASGKGSGVWVLTTSASSISLYYYLHGPEAMCASYRGLRLFRLRM